MLSSKILVSVRIRIWIRNQLQAGSGSGSGFSKIPGSGSGLSEYGSKTLLLIQGFRSKLKIVRYWYINSGGLLPHKFKNILSSNILVSIWIRISLQAESRPGSGFSKIPGSRFSRKFKKVPYLNSGVTASSIFFFSRSSCLPPRDG
jgi:hypothetical protein